MCLSDQSFPYDNQLMRVVMRVVSVCLSDQSFPFDDQLMRVVMAAMSVCLSLLPNVTTCDNTVVHGCIYYHDD